jgi:hypothetical protein
VQAPVDDDVLQTVHIGLLSGVALVYYTTLEMSEWHSDYSEFCGALGQLFKHANTFPWDSVANKLSTWEILSGRQFRTFIYPCLVDSDSESMTWLVDLDAEWHLMRQLEGIYASSEHGALLGCVLHELRWDDWFYTRQTHTVMPPQGYGLLIVPADNPFWTDEHADALKDQQVYPSLTLDDVAKYLAMGAMKVLQAIDDARGTLEQWLIEHEGMVTRRKMMDIDPISEEDYHLMEEHVPAMIDLAYRSYLIKYD